MFSVSKKHSAFSQQTYPWGILSHGKRKKLHLASDDQTVFTPTLTSKTARD